MKKPEMAKAYKVIGWCMIAYAIIDIALCALNLIQLDTVDIEANVKTFVIVAAIAITAIDAFFYVLAGIAGIKLNFRMGKVAFVALIITSVIYLVGIISGKNYSPDDLRIILMPAVYGCFMLPAKKDAVGKYTERDEICKATDKENFSCLKLPMPDKAYLIGRYHDIGKSGISNALWESSPRFSDAEYKLAQLHTVIGAHFVKPTLSLAGLSDDSDLLSIIAKCCLFHHERWDGSGYPFGLKGEQIPLYARIVAIADCYDAMIEERPYKKNMSSESAIAEIRQQKGKQFDPVLADIFCEAMLYKKI